MRKQWNCKQENSPVGTGPRGCFYENLCSVPVCYNRYYWSYRTTWLQRIIDGVYLTVEWNIKRVIIIHYISKQWPPISTAAAPFVQLKSSDTADALQVLGWAISSLHQVARQTDGRKRILLYVSSYGPPPKPPPRHPPCKRVQGNDPEYTIGILLDYSSTLNKTPRNRSHIIPILMNVKETVCGENMNTYIYTHTHTCIYIYNYV